MKFGLVHRILTNTLAALGVLAVVNTSSLSPWTTAIVLAGLVAALAMPERWQTQPALRHLATVGPLTLLAVQGIRLVSGQPAIDIAVEFAAILQIIRLATRRGAAHDQQIIVLALLHFVAGTVLGGGLTYGLCFLGFLIVAPGALVLSHLRREVEGNYRQGARDRTGLPVDVPRILRSRRVVGRGFLATTCLLSLPIFLFTALLFVLFPRVGLSLFLLNHPQKGRMVGFSDRVDLGEVGVLRTDPSIALRFSVQDLPEPPPARLTLRLRGTAFDRYDGRRWERTQRDRSRGSDGTLDLVRRADISDRRITFDLEPIDPPVVFLPPRTIAVKIHPQQQAGGDPILLSRGPESEVRYHATDIRGLRYDAYVSGDREPIIDLLPAQDRSRYLELPPQMPARIAELAHEWADDQPTPYLKAKALEEHLKHDFKYDTSSPSGGTPQPVDHFLFESKRGHCEFFSTAMAIMLRELGIPSRNVTGFVGGTYNRFGRYYAVREGDAHSWIEAYLDEPIRGWVTFDPTPTSGAQPLQSTSGFYVYARDLVEALSQRWNRYVVGYDLKTQVRLFDDIRRSYNTLRKQTGTDRGWAERVTRGPILAGATVLMTFVVYVAWKRRRLSPTKQGDSRRPVEDPRVEAATALYRSLELALNTQGLTRPASIPPLRYAQDLALQSHPLANEILYLTHRYIEVRFGGGALDPELTKDFEARLRTIKMHRAPMPSANAGL